MSVYATPADIIIRYDAARLGELVRDDGSRATATQLLTDATLIAILLDGSELLDSAMVSGGYYTQADLTALMASGDKSPLVRLCCDLTYGLLVARRGYTEEEVGRLAPRYKAAMETIEMLRDGKRVFLVPGRADTASPLNVQISKSVTLVSAQDRIFGDLTTETSNDTFTA